MAVASDLSRLSDQLFVWSVYDPHVKADLFSSALRLTEGWLIVDPVPLDPGLDLPWPDEPVAGVVVTNENHLRASDAFARDLSAPLLAHPDSRLRALPLTPRQSPFADLAVIDIEGAPAGEITLHHSADGGTLIVGDALIQMEPMGFALLPAKYCRNQKTMRRSLRSLLDYPCTRILFAHGSPLVHHASARLAQLLAES